ncbi:MAG: hypothetical protein KBC96_05890 [Armatimonadetes bacterium]|nr:hypothetical protein [Armatimonadota bacterium]
MRCFVTCIVMLAIMVALATPSSANAAGSFLAGFLRGYSDAKAKQEAAERAYQLEAEHLRLERLRVELEQARISQQRTRPDGIQATTPFETGFVRNPEPPLFGAEESNTVISNVEDGQSYWRRVLREQYDFDAPAGASVLEMIEFESTLDKIKEAATQDRGTGLVVQPLSGFNIAPVGQPEPVPMRTNRYLGDLSSNEYDPESISNRFGSYGNPYGNTLTSPYSEYGSAYSSHSWRNPYATDTPRIYAADGTYLGKLSSNKYDPDSITNPYGRYGSRFGNNLMNPYSQYGSRYGSQSWNNPYAVSPPKVFAGSSYR